MKIKHHKKKSCHKKATEITIEATKAEEPVVEPVVEPACKAVVEPTEPAKPAEAGCCTSEKKELEVEGLEVLQATALADKLALEAE